MSFVSRWKTSSAQAGEEYYRLRFDENEIDDFRRGLLNSSAKAKFDFRVRKYAKMSGALIGGCLGLMLVLMIPFAVMFGYAFYKIPSVFAATFGALFVALIIAAYTFIGLKLFNLSKDVKTDLKNERVNVEQGNLSIKVHARNDSLQAAYSINNVEFKVLQDALGAEIDRQFLSPVVNVGDSRTTAENYRFYYLPQSKLILHYEQI